jgi:hypothetical protein
VKKPFLDAERIPFKLAEMIFGMVKIQKGKGTQAMPAD